jgi:hypothetical protein
MHRDKRTQHGLGKAILALANVVDELEQCQSLDLFGLGVGRIVAFEVKDVRAQAQLAHEQVLALGRRTLAERGQWCKEIFGKRQHGAGADVDRHAGGCGCGRGCP